MRIRPTALGVKGALFFATVVLLFLATPYSNLFFLMTAFLAVIGLLGVTGAWRNLRATSAELVAVGQAAAGSSHDVDLHLRGGSRHFQLDVLLEVDGKLCRVARMPMLAGSTVLRGSLAGRDRGVHRVTALVLSSRYPFGVCRAQRRVPVDAEAVAYPAPARITPELAARLGDHHGHRPAGGTESVAGLRPFRTGDALRDVHWRATARRGEPVVKEREDLLDSGLELVLDRRTDPATLDQALAVGAALLLAAAERKQLLQFSSQGLRAAYGPGQRPTAHGLRWLAATSPLDCTAEAPPAAGPAAVRLPRRPAGARR